MQRTAILNGSNINFDKDYSLTAVALMTPGVVEGLEVTTNSVAPGKAFIQVERTATTPNETFYIVFENTEAVTIDTSGDKKVFVKIPKVNVNDPAYNATSENIATIQTDTDYPTEDYIPLASITGGVITDEREFIKLRQAVLNLLNLTQDISTSGDITATNLIGNGSQITGLSAEVESTSLTYMLGSAGVLGKGYSLEDYKQAGSGTEIDLGSTAQPMVAQSFYGQIPDFTSLPLMLRTEGTPDDGVFIEIQTDNAGEPSGTVVTNGTSNTIDYTAIAGTLTEETFTFASAPELTEETLYWIVVKRTSSTSGVNYYVLGSAGSDSIIGTLSTNNGTAWANQTDDLYFQIPGYKLAKIGGTNFVGICQEAKAVGLVAKFNKNYDKNQTGLTVGEFYGIDKDTGDVVDGSDFRAISETELLIDEVMKPANKVVGTAKAGESIEKGDFVFQYPEEFKDELSQPDTGTGGADLPAGTRDLFTFTAKSNGGVDSVKTYGLTRGSNTNAVIFYLTDMSNTVLQTSEEINWNSSLQFRTHSFPWANVMTPGVQYKIRWSHTYSMDMYSIGGNNVDFYHVTNFSYVAPDERVYLTDGADSVKLDWLGVADNDALEDQPVNVVYPGYPKYNSLVPGDTYYLDIQAVGFNIINPVTKGTYDFGSITSYGITFNNDGTIFYCSDYTNDRVHQFPLATAWDITSAQATTGYLSIGDNYAYDIKFSADGTELYIMADSANTVRQYTLSTAWDVTSGTFTRSFSPGDSRPYGIAFNPQGTKMYLALGEGTDAIREYDLSTAWDISTTSVVGDFSFASETSYGGTLFLTEDGTKMFLCADIFTTQRVREYTMSTPFDITTCSLTNTYTKAGIQGLAFSNDGTRMFTMLYGTQVVEQFDTFEIESVPGKITNNPYGDARKVGRALTEKQLMLIKDPIPDDAVAFVVATTGGGSASYTTTYSHDLGKIPEKFECFACTSSRDSFGWYEDGKYGSASYEGGARTDSIGQVYYSSGDYFLMKIQNVTATSFDVYYQEVGSCSTLTGRVAFKLT